MQDSTTVREPTDEQETPLPADSKTEKPAPMFRAWRHRNFRLYLVGQLITHTGGWMEQTTLGWLVYQMTGSQWLLGVIAAAGALPLFLFALWGGSLADRFPKRRILYVTQTLVMTFAFVLAWLVWSGRVRPWEIVLVAALNGTVYAFDVPTRQAFVLEVTGREDLLGAISLTSSVFNAARLIGPAVAGLTMAAFGAAVCIFLNGLSFLAVIVSLLLIRLAPSPEVPQKLSGWEHAVSGLRYVRKHGRALGILSLFATVVIFGWSYMALLPAIARDIYGASPRGYGALAASIGLGALGGALFTATVGDRYPTRVVTLGGLWLFAAALLAFSVTRSLPLGIALQATAHFGMMLFLAASQSALQRTVADEMQGRVMGIWSLTVGAMMPLGNLGAGWCADRLGLSTTMAGGAILCAAGGAVAFALGSRERRTHGPLAST